jgi:hypothetical protein
LELGAVEAHDPDLAMPAARCRPRSVRQSNSPKYSPACVVSAPPFLGERHPFDLPGLDDVKPSADGHGARSYHWQNVSSRHAPSSTSSASSE